MSSRAAKAPPEGQLLLRDGCSGSEKVEGENDDSDDEDDMYQSAYRLLHQEKTEQPDYQQHDADCQEHFSSPGEDCDNLERKQYSSV